ncbi:MAG: hypothetical protein C0399_06385 [Syntrophus sp. (in: bacteria)]|nr:hypothetical protein [Syntrophus sp. (in: bacteria)]
MLYIKLPPPVPLSCTLLLLLCLLVPSTLGAFWPLSWELGNEKRYLGPLISYDEENQEKHLVLRPFLFSYDSEEGGVYQYLFPLGKITPEKSYFVPIYLSKRSETESDTAFLLFFGGKSQKGSYGGFFPFYGKLYNRFAKDEIGFVAWPFYSYIEDEGATKTNLLWPFIAFYGGTDKGFKVWPLYGNHERSGVRKKQFVLWPIFFKDEKNLDTDEPVHSFIAMPFYLHSKSSTKEYQAVLWPFFTHAKDSDKEKWDIPWPIYSKTIGEETKGYSFFPIISESIKGRDRTFSFLWPIYREYEFYVKDERFFQRSIMAINRYTTDDRGTFFNVWPFFEYEANNEHSTFLFPSILPFRDQGFDRIIKPLITLYEHKRIEDRSTTNILYGLFTHEEEDETWKTRFAFLLTLKRDQDGIGFEFLSGLFGFDSKSVKIFFIPIRRSTPDPSQTE